MPDLSISNIGITLIFLSYVISRLPESPFRAFIGGIQSIPYLDVLNWFIPVSEMIAVLQAWLLAITGYYIISLIARWIKVIE